MAVDEVNDTIGNDIWEKLAAGQGLDKYEEAKVIHYIKSSSIPLDSEVGRVVTSLRERTGILRDKSWEEMCKTVDSMRHLMLLNVDSHLGKAIQLDFEAAKQNAQANRIENALKESAKTNVPVPKVEMPKFEFNKAPNIRDFPEAKGKGNEFSIGPLFVWT
jgi:hypothetical protein